MYCERKNYPNVTYILHLLSKISPLMLLQTKYYLGKMLLQAKCYSRQNVTLGKMFLGKTLLQAKYYSRQNVTLGKILLEQNKLNFTQAKCYSRQNVTPGKMLLRQNVTRQMLLDKRLCKFKVHYQNDPSGFFLSFDIFYTSSSKFNFQC